MMETAVKFLTLDNYKFERGIVFPTPFGYMRENALTVLILLNILLSDVGADLRHCNFMCKR